MIGADKDPQQYKLSGHEFKAVGHREKSGFSFTLEVFENKAKNNIKASTVARDLLYILQQSQKATELMKSNTYELRMDKQFVLHVTRKNAEVPVVPVEVAEEVPAAAE
jgi:hypothetical protein